MLRLNKFRVWDLEYKNFVTRIDGDLRLNCHGELVVETEFSISYLNSGRFVVQLCSGLKDIDGNDIYEGDIIEDLRPQFYSRKKIVEFDKGTFGYKIDKIDTPWQILDPNQFRVVGHIYESTTNLDIVYVPL